MTSLPDPALIVMLGAPGAGKSTWVRTRFAATQILCLDAFRAIVADDENDQDATADAAALMHQALTARLARRLTTVVDATNARRDVRDELTRTAAAHRVPAVAVVLATPLQLCLARQAARPGPATGARWGRRVDPAIVQRIHRQITAALPGLSAEFDTVHIVTAGEGVR